MCPKSPHRRAFPGELLEALAQLPLSIKGLHDGFDEGATKPVALAGTGCKSENPPDQRICNSVSTDLLDAPCRGDHIVRTFTNHLPQVFDRIMSLLFGHLVALPAGVGLGDGRHRRDGTPGAAYLQTRLCSTTQGTPALAARGPAAPRATPANRPQPPVQQLGGSPELDKPTGSVTDFTTRGALIPDHHGQHSLNRPPRTAIATF
jgi:hypothetical protein